MAVIVKGVRELQGALTRMAARQNAATRTGLSKAAHLLEREIKANLSIGSHGPHETTNSRPGEPPDLVSGDLRRSVMVDGPYPTNGTQWAADVGPTMEYARIQELGGVAGRGAVLPARPYVAPALEAMKPIMAGVMKESWTEGQRL